MLLYDQPGTVRVVSARSTVATIQGRITVEAVPPSDVSVTFTPTSPDIRNNGWTYAPADPGIRTVRAEVLDLSGSVVAFLRDDDWVIPPGQELTITFPPTP